MSWEQKSFSTGRGTNVQEQKSGEQKSGEQKSFNLASALACLGSLESLGSLPGEPGYTGKPGWPGRRAPLHGLPVASALSSPMMIQLYLTVSPGAPSIGIVSAHGEYIYHALPERSLLLKKPPTVHTDLKIIGL